MENLLGLDTLARIKFKMPLVKWVLEQWRKYLLLKNFTRFLKSFVSPQSDTCRWNALDVIVNLVSSMLENLLKFFSCQCVPRCRFKYATPICSSRNLQRNVKTEQSECNNACGFSKIQEPSLKSVLVIWSSVSAVVDFVDWIRVLIRPE